VHVARVDALDEAEVHEYVRTVVEDAGALDVSFNLIGVGDVHGTPVVDMSLAFAASDMAGAVTGSTINTSAGTTTD
jgi:hypothetical protein